LDETRSRHIVAPSRKIMICTVAPAVPAFLVMAARVRAKQHTSGFQTCVQFQQHARQLLAGYMKQRGVGKYTIEMVIRQIELEEILLPYVAAAVGARHCGEVRSAFQADRNVTEFGKHLEVAPGPQPKSSIVKG